MAELQTLAKALDILLLLGEEKNGLSVEGIAGRLEIPESTTYRLLQTLEKKGFVERENRGSLVLGYSILNLARDTYEKIDRQLGLAASAAMEQLTEDLCETSLLSVRSSVYSTALLSIPCKERIRFVADEKRLMPIHLGASGRAILAYESDKIYQQALSNLKEKEEQRILEERICFTRKHGYAISRSEFDEGSLGIAVPVYDLSGRVCASLGIIGPEYRIREAEIESRIVPRLQEASKAITQQLTN